jgi:hypothetical protein
VAASSKNWTCPFCNRPQTLTSGQSYNRMHYLNLKDHKYGEARVSLRALACANPQCREITLTAVFTEGGVTHGIHGTNYTAQNVVAEYKLRPESSASPNRITSRRPSGMTTMKLAGFVI